MLKIKRIIHIVKMLKKALDVKTIEEVDEKLTDFYESMGIIENKHRTCDTCIHHNKMTCPNSKDCYSIEYKPFYTRKSDKNAKN